MFNTGDKVYIVRRVEQEDGWDNTWPRSLMDPFISDTTTYTVYSTRPSGVSFVEIPYSWPPGALLLAKAYVPPTKEELVLKRIKKLWNNSNYVKKNKSQSFA